MRRNISDGHVEKCNSESTDRHNPNHLMRLKIPDHPDPQADFAQCKTRTSNEATAIFNVLIPGPRQVRGLGALVWQHLRHSQGGQFTIAFDNEMRQDGFGNGGLTCAV